MAGLTEFYCGWNEPSHSSQFKWLEYTFKEVILLITRSTWIPRYKLASKKAKCPRTYRQHGTILKASLLVDEPV
jgi:hypothetical protein